MRVYKRAYAEPFILPAYSSARVYACMRAYVRRRVQPSWTLKAGVDIPSNQMRLRGSRSTNGYRRHGNLHAYTRLRSYLKFTTHLRGAILALGVAQRGAYARTKYESSFRVQLMIHQQCVWFVKHAEMCVVNIWSRNFYCRCTTQSIFICQTMHRKET